MDKIKSSKEIPLIITSEADILIPELSEIFTIIDILPEGNLELEYPYLFLYLLNKKGDIFNFNNISFQCYKYNIFYPFFSELTDSSIMEQVINNIDKNIGLINFSFLDPLFWYEFETEVRKLNKELKNKGKIKVVYRESHNYVFEYNDFGEAWKISFAYDEPISVKPMLGLTYIAYLLRYKNKRVHSEELKKRFGVKVSKNPRTDSLDSVKKAIYTAIKFISDKEAKYKQVSEVGDLSTFLNKSIQDTKYGEFVYIPEGLTPDFDPDWKVRLSIESTINENVF